MHNISTLEVSVGSLPLYYNRSLISLTGYSKRFTNYKLGSQFCRNFFVKLPFYLIVFLTRKYYILLFATKNPRLKSELKWMLYSKLCSTFYGSTKN